MAASIEEASKLLRFYFSVSSRSFMKKSLGILRDQAWFVVRFLNRTLHFISTQDSNLLKDRFLKSVITKTAEGSIKSHAFRSYLLKPKFTPWNMS
jgi:hypothetical protein